MEKKILNFIWHLNLKKDHNSPTSNQADLLPAVMHSARCQMFEFGCLEQIGITRFASTAIKIQRSCILQILCLVHFLGSQLKQVKVQVTKFTHDPLWRQSDFDKAVEYIIRTWILFVRKNIQMKLNGRPLEHASIFLIMGFCLRLCHLHHSGEAHFLVKWRPAQ